MDFWAPVTKFFDRYRYTALSLAVVAGSTFYLTACKSTTLGPVSGTPVERAAFDREVAEDQAAIEKAIADVNTRVESHNAAIDAGYDDLDKQDAVRAEFVKLATGVATSAATGGITTPGLINAAVTAMGLLGLGSVADNKRKDKIIKSGKVAK